MYCYIWEYRIDPLTVDDFEAAYAPDGRWAQLFQQAPGYIRTELLQEHGRSERYLTIDYWVDRQACRQFRLDFQAEFQSLDQACEAYTKSERHIGDFEVR